jgi:hypothetical protein
MSGVVFLLPGTTLEDITDAIRTALATELARLDVAVSTRATPEDVTVQVYSEPVPEGRVS